MHAKDAVDVRLVPNANLDMCLATKPGVSVNVLTFGKDPANSVEWLFFGPVSREMKKVDDRAIQLAKTEVGATDILRHLGAGDGNDRLETSISLFNGMNAIGTDEV